MGAVRRRERNERGGSVRADGVGACGGDAALCGDRAAHDIHKRQVGGAEFRAAGVCS